jgi:hypothetical protein
MLAQVVIYSVSYMFSSNSEEIAMIGPVSGRGTRNLRKTIQGQGASLRASGRRGRNAAPDVGLRGPRLQARG